jgi:hypothetical protein
MKLNSDARVVIFQSETPFVFELYEFSNNEDLKNM